MSSARCRSNGLKRNRKRLATDATDIGIQPAEQIIGALQAHAFKGGFPVIFGFCARIAPGLHLPRRDTVAGPSTRSRLAIRLDRPGCGGQCSGRYIGGVGNTPHLPRAPVTACRLPGHGTAARHASVKDLGMAGATQRQQQSQQISHRLHRIRPAKDSSAGFHVPTKRPIGAAPSAG